jgi:hypothetical protein
MNLFNSLRALFLLFALTIPLLHAEGESPPLSEQDKYAEGLRTVVRETLAELHDKANSTDSPDRRNIKGFVLSTEVNTFRDIPANIDQDIQALRESIRALIYKVATDIELTGSSGRVSITSGGMINYEDLPADAVKEIERLMDAKTKNNVSVRSINLAIQTLADINKQLMTEAEKAVDVKQKRKLYITQAAFVYEMSDIVVDILKNVSLEGKAELEKIATENQQRINERMQTIDNSIDKVKQAQSQGAISAETAGKQEHSYNLMREANKQTLQAWQDFVQKISQQDNALQNIKVKHVAIELIRDNAKMQLDTLRDIAVVGEFHSLLGNIDELMATIEGLELLELTPETVRTLLFGNPVHEGADMNL